MTNTDYAHIGTYILMRTPVRPVDIALVFGTSRNNALFAKHISGLWQQGMFRKAVLTGGVLSKEKDERESLHLKSLLLEKGVPNDALVTEIISSNTGENVQYAMPILTALHDEGYDTGTILGIGKNFAARRCLMTMQKYMPDARKMFYAINPFDVEDDAWTTSPLFFEKVMAEYGKIPRYLKEGFIAELTDTSLAPE